MMRRFRRSVLAGGLFLLVVVVALAVHRSHRVAFYARTHLALDLSSTPFGSPPSAIPGLKPYPVGVADDGRGLTWYSSEAASIVPLLEPPPSGVLYGYLHGQLAEIRVTRWTPPAGNYRYSRDLFLYSMSPSLFSTLRRTGGFQFTDSSYSLRCGGGCDPLRPTISFFTITPRSS